MDMKGSLTPSSSFDSVLLPSRGKLYKTGPLVGSSTIDIYYLTARHEDILTSPNLLRTGKMMDVLLKNVIVNKEIEVESLLAGDRDAIFVWLRSTGYGSDYEVKITCRSCLNSYDTSINLNDIKTVYLEEDPDFDGLFTFVLPSNKTIRYSYLTSRDQNNIDALVEQTQKRLGTNIDNKTTFRLCTMIKEIDGNQDPMAIKQFVDSMLVRDSLAFRKHLGQKEPGLDMSVEVTCTNCGITNKEVIPLGITFWWPD